MKIPEQYRVFWGGFSPLTFFTGAGLLIMASGRLAHAITVAGALVWVHCLSSLAAHFGVRIFPRRGRLALVAFLASFFAGVYLFLWWLLSPLCALESFFIISFVPMFYMVSGILGKLEATSIKDTISASLFEALLLGIFIIIFALIREPIGFLSLSLPGGSQGIMLLFSIDREFIFPVRILAGSSGALILLGYVLALFRYFREAKNVR